MDFKYINKEYFLILQMASEKRDESENGKNLENDDNGSSNLQDLEGEDSRQSQENELKKLTKEEAEKQSQIRKVFISNRHKEKLIQTDHSYDGIYLYKPGVELPSLFHLSNHAIKIIIASEYLKKHNPQVMKRNIYGTDTYSSNSDCVCMAIHSGLVNVQNFPAKRYEGIQLTCKVIKPKKNYLGSLKNGLLSRSIKGFNGNALKPDGIKNLTTLGPMDLLEKYASNMHIPIGKGRVRSKPKNIASIIPIPETHLIFNVNNEPAYKYSLFNLADKGYEKGQFLIKKLDNYVLYLETSQGEKYELFKVCGGDNEIYQLGKLKNGKDYDNNYFCKNKAPVNDNQIDMLEKNLEWEDISWGNTSMKAKSRLIDKLISFKYYKKDGK